MIMLFAIKKKKKIQYSLLNNTIFPCICHVVTLFFFFSLSLRHKAQVHLNLGIRNPALFPDHNYILPFHYLRQTQESKKNYTQTSV